MQRLTAYLRVPALIALIALVYGTPPARADGEPRGGTYMLVDPNTGKVMRTGQTNDLDRRQQEHARGSSTPETKGLVFLIDRRTDNYAERRGREAVLNSLYTPPLDKQTPISDRNSNKGTYLDSARRFEEKRVNDYYRTRSSVEVVKDPAKVDAVRTQYGRIPGGIIVAAQPAEIPTRLASLAYDPSANSFRVNGNLEYRPGVLPVEVAALWRSITSSPGKLAAVSQSKVIGISPASSIALLLTSADTTFGSIIYGYDVYGRPPPATRDGYDNPDEHEMRRLLPLLRTDPVSVAKHLVTEAQPRAFLLFDRFRFETDSANGLLAPTSADIQCVFIGFDGDDRIAKLSNAGAERFPLIEAALRHFRDNYWDYERLYPEFAVARRTAETYSLLRLAAAQKIPVVGLDGLDAPAPTDYAIAENDYAQLGPDSPYVSRRLQVLEELDRLRLEDSLPGTPAPLLRSVIGVALSWRAFRDDSVARHRIAALQQVRRDPHSLAALESLGLPQEAVTSLLASSSVAARAQLTVAEELIVDGRWELASKYVAKAQALFSSAAKIEPEHYAHLAGLISADAYQAALQGCHINEGDALRACLAKAYHPAQSRKLERLWTQWAALFDGSKFDLAGAYLSDFAVIPPDRGKAEALLEELAKRDHDPSCYALAVRKLQGHDVNRAIQLLRQSAGHGHLQSKHLLALLLFKTTSSPYDAGFREATTNLFESAAGGYPWAEGHAARFLAVLDEVLGVWGMRTVAPESWLHAWTREPKKDAEMYVERARREEAVGLEGIADAWRVGWAPFVDHGQLAQSASCNSNVFARAVISGNLPKECSK